MHSKLFALVPATLAFFGIVNALPSVLEARTLPDHPQKVRIVGVSLLGSGCPAGTADVQVDATGSLFEATFSEYQVITGPGTKPDDWRKNCKLTLNMEFDSGYQFSILETDMSGFAEVPKGVTGVCSNTFYFTGNNQNKVEYGIKIKGEYSDDFNLHSDPGIAAWSPCGGSTAILNMNTQCNIRPTRKQALIDVDSVSGKLTVKFAVQWRHC